VSGVELYSHVGEKLSWATGGLFYRPKSPSTSRTTSRIVPSTELKILQEFIES
jgi:hypothetical protein